MPPRKRTRPTGADPADRLEAHVAFELSRWAEPGLTASLSAEVDALLAWLDGVTLADLAPADEWGRAAAEAVAGLVVTDELVGLVVDVLLSARAVLVESDAAYGDLVEPEDIDEVVEVLGGMGVLRGRVIEAVTDNPAYHRLIAHVLYRGVKAYVLTDNAVARKVPGAQSLIRLGQRGLSSAAPRLEEAVDRQLQAFVQANIGDTLRDSRRFLEETLTTQMLHETVDDVRESLRENGIASLADAASDEEVESLTVVAAPLVRSLLASGHLGTAVGEVVTRVLELYADSPVGPLLVELGLDAPALADRLLPFVRPVVATALDTGYLEERVRARLAPFYATLG